jgi:ribosomal protein S18 acetylase RimI-like enzyme
VGTHIRIVQCSEKDVDGLINIGKETYYHTFREYCTGDVMEAYLTEAFSKRKILSELNNPNSTFYFCLSETQRIGYIKINRGDAQTDLHEEEGLEIERIYVIEALKGRGIGSQLIEFCVEKAISLHKAYLWLGVWEKNRDAIAFYEKKGFQKVGTHPFRMGEELQTDLIMKRYV